MNRRRKLITAAVFVLLLCVLLAPLAQLLSLGDHTLDQKQAAIARALEMEKERSALSPYVPVQGVPDIEDIWAIEDARTETDAELVDSMRCSTGEMGYDAESRTFYATLGIENGDEWPEIALSARGAEDVQVVWIDDYSYDWCAEAIREGYRYELLAYTQSQYAYIGVVFTGLPVVTLHAEGEIVMGSDVPGRATVAAAGYEPVDTAMVVHQRGGGIGDPGEKKSYRIEFHMLGQKARDQKREIGVLGMDPDSDWLLLSNSSDDTAVRNKLAFDLWKDWNTGKDAFMVMRSELVEVFLNDEYRGIYQIMERIDEEEEIVRIGGSKQTDCVVRVVTSTNPTDRPVLKSKEEDPGICLEYRYERANDVERAFELAADYIDLTREMPENQLDDELFISLVKNRINIENMMEYTLFYHACTLRDNKKNNIYLYILREEDGQYRYFHAPWDMDTSFWVRQSSRASDKFRWPDQTFVLPTRMLEQNAENCREVLWALWNEKRATVLSEESIHLRITDIEERINSSGAYLRESAKWHGKAVKLDLSEMAYCAAGCLDLVRLTLEEKWPVEGMLLAQ